MNSCANSNSSTKLRGTKSSELREDSSSNNQLTKNQIDDIDKCEKKINKTNCEIDKITSSNDFGGVPKGTLVICQKNTNNHTICSDNNSISRIKQRNCSERNRNESRMARGGGSIVERNRGGTTRSKPFNKKNQNDRDANQQESGYPTTTRQKFQESLKNLDNTQNKFYDDKRINDESRISKLLRRLCREDDHDHVLPLVKQIQDAILSSENQKTLRRNLEGICEALYDVLHMSISADSKKQITKCLSHIGYVVTQDFRRFLDWIFDKYGIERKDDIKCLLIKSLTDVLKMDSDSHKLKDYSMITMSHLQTILENVDRSDLLMVTVDAILIVTDNYPDTFTNHFQDTVDILVGWHLDYTQSKTVVTYASKSLQKLHNYWISDIQFTLTLLSQFLEDMEGCDADLTVNNKTCDETIPGPKECILKITSLISVFNTVTKSVADNLNPNLTSDVQWTFLIECLVKMLKTVLKVIEFNEKHEAEIKSINNNTKNNHNATANGGGGGGGDIDDDEEENDQDEDLKNLNDSMKSLNLTQKNMNTIMRKFNDESINDHRGLLKIVKTFNSGKKKDDKKLLHKDNDIDIDKKINVLMNLLKNISFKKSQKLLNLSRQIEDLIIVANECAYHLLTLLQTRVTKNHDLLYKFIDIQLDKSMNFFEDTIISTLNIISKIIKEISANLPIVIVDKLLGSNSALLKLRFKNSIRIQNSSLMIYHSLLNLKNIPLVQEAYRYILADLEIAYKLIVPNFNGFDINNPLTDTISYQENNAEIIVIFILRALSTLANASNSIIGMWALKPSILELLAVKMLPYDEILCQKNPLFHYTLLYLLYGHCSRYNNFVSSSNLISSNSTLIEIGAIDVTTTSPTSGNLTKILYLINKLILTNSTPEKTLLLLLNWIKDIFNQAVTYFNILKYTDEFMKLIMSLLNIGANINHKIASSVCNNIEILLNDKKIIWSELIYEKIVDLSILHLTSYDRKTRLKYSQLLMNVPINVTIPRINREYLQSESKKIRAIDNYSIESLMEAQRLHMRGNNHILHVHNTSTTITTSSTTTTSSNNGNGEMQAQNFKTYMTFLLQDNHVNAFELSEMFTLCWPTVTDSHTISKMYKFGIANRSFLFFWSGIQAAQYCVLNKLRTPLGKPQETFTTIERSLKTLARDITCKPLIHNNNNNNNKNKNDIEYSLNQHTKVRLFVEFLEHLERAIHNGAEGCAIALSSLPKPVRTFFYTNKSTCREWLIRIRLALCVVSLHAGLATNALRNGQRLIEDLTDIKTTHKAEFERAVFCTAQALIMLGETEALQGLYIHTKDKDNKFYWLKAAIEEAAGHYENAADSYKMILSNHLCTSTLTPTTPTTPPTPTTSMSDETSSTPTATTASASASPNVTSPTSENESSINGDSQIAEFAMQHLVRCYSSVCDWEQLEKWTIQENEILKNENNILLTKNIQLFGNTTITQAKCLKNFENNEISSIDELSNWNLLDEKATTNWSCKKTMLECSNTLMNIALKIHSDRNNNDNDESNNKINNNKYYEKIELVRKIVGKTIEESLRNIPSEYLNDSILIQYSTRGLVDLLNNKKPDVFELLPSEKIKNLDCNVMGKILWWSDYFSRCYNDDSNTTINNNNDHVSRLRLEVVRNARKEGNFKLAKREITKYFINEKLFDIELNDTSNIFTDIKNKILNDNINITWTQNNMRAFKELSKLLFTMESIDDAVKICSITALGISRSIVNNDNDKPSNNLRKIGTKLMLTLGKWIQQQEINLSKNIQLTELLRFESIHNDKLMDKLFGQTTELIPHCDIIIGKLMQLGVNQCPELPTAWSNFAAWCYKWGRKIVDNSHTGQLTEMDITKIKSLLPSDINDTDTASILSILNQNKSIPEDEGDIETNDVKTYDMIEQQLQQVPILSNANHEQLEILVDIWKQAQKRIYSYYELSANAYFKYLELSNGETNDCATITATLRLLRLIVKHALELQNVLESGLATTPTGPWKEIIPQLFSRLSHPELYVRTRVSELLCRIAENSPQLITFPAVVGAISDNSKDFNNIPQRYVQRNNNNNNDNSDNDNLTNEQNGVVKSINSEDDDDDEDDDEEDKNIDYHNDEHKTFLDACFAQLADCLSTGFQESVNHIKIFVKELRRITLLWDELWLGAFCQHHSDITKRFEQLEIEIQKVQDNMWLTIEEKDKLIIEKHRIILKPIIFILENLITITTVTAETPHEKQFQDKFGPSIDEVIRRLKNPKNPSKPQTTSILLKQLETKLAQKVNKRSAYSLSMKDISPVLANMKNTKIAMPGVFIKDKNKLITIHSVDSHVQILPTKTKPKKLMFHGSDGHIYTYLFKGLEDLHLDERIMQFLTICNTMMSKNNDTKKIYRARHYSVIPLGPRSGLIQWVDGVTPLFALYKRWQQREISMSSTKNINNTNNNTTVMRPSELFYNKLAPLLKERDIPLENRKEWPLPILKQVLSELMNETPKDLLAKELWCNSINSGNWWQATKSYSYSVAVMSIIGYIIGLGDRHLDNVLVDLNKGEVVHIDYNVCFEKGKTLRVPEKVPFRMTPNIKTALGVTGVEGIFRLACEHTLRVMRRGRETLLTLLEAFVYDPLVDWRAGAENTITTYGVCQNRGRFNNIDDKKTLEKELTKAMFAVRITEIKGEWLSNRESMLRILPLLSKQMNDWLDTNNTTRQCQDLLNERHKQLSFIKEAQVIGKNHQIYTIIKRYNTFKKTRDIHEKAKLCLKEKIDECEKHISMHNIALCAVRNSTQLSIWLNESRNQPKTAHEDHMVFDLVKEFLQNAGQSQMIIQCEQSENDLTTLAIQESLLIRNCLDLLNQYSTICNFYPLSTITKKHRSIIYHTLANKLLITGTLDTCHDVIKKFDYYFTPPMINDKRVQRIIKFSYQLQEMINKTNDKFNKNYEKMVTNEGLPDAKLRIDNIYSDIKQQINTFLQRDNIQAEKSFECVNINTFCTLNKRILLMEGAAKGAAECLVDLTSREGDWFLDEMRLMSSLVVELVNLIPIDNSNDIKNENYHLSKSLDCLKITDGIYQCLQELNYNFQMIILPEAIKTIIIEEPSVMMIINEINDIILSIGIPINDLLKQLDNHLTFTLMDIDSPHELLENIINNIRNKFELMLSSTPITNLDNNNQNQDTDILTPGKMLLMGFNGLFEKLQAEGNLLINTLSTLDVPACWKKIDQIIEAKKISVPIFHDKARQVLDDIFLIKRLNTINEFFNMCQDIAKNFIDINTTTTTPTNISSNIINFDDEKLIKPVKLFIADYVSRQLLGVTSQALGIAICYLLQRMGLNVTSEIEQRDIGAESKVSIEELCRKMIDTCLRNGTFNGTLLGQAGVLCTTLETTWRRKISSRISQQSVDITRSTLQRLQLQFTAHYWLHEDCLTIGRINLNTINPLNRSTFMLELRKTVAALNTIQSRVFEAKEQQQNLVMSVDQRLKWAAGANPALAEVMAAFGNAVILSNDKLNKQKNLAIIISNTCSSILHYEALRTRTTESITNDNNFLKLIKQWEESCALRTNLSVNISLVEENLVELFQFDNNNNNNNNNIDINWLIKAEKRLSDVIIDNQKLLQQKQDLHKITEEALKERSSDLQIILTEHHRLMNDVRTLLRTLVKQENIPGLQEYLTEYRIFIENISGLVKEFESDNLEQLRIIESKVIIDTLTVKVGKLYDELLNISNELIIKTKLNDDNNLTMTRRAKLVRQDTSVCLSPRKGIPLVRDPTTGKAVQERNAYALNVWRRVRMKLEGRDPISSRKYTTAEQVEYVIREAQSFDNLALLYEGWTPWV